MSDNWSRKYNKCVNCGNNNVRHEAHGMCLNCYKQHYNMIANYNKILFVCELCNKEFYNLYPLKDGYRLRFCSKSCAGKFYRKFSNKNQLENVICKEIKIANKYLTRDEILSKLKISSKTLCKYRISTFSLNKKCKMRKPKSIFEYKTGSILQEIFPDLIFEQSFVDLKSSKGYLLRFDFYSPFNNLLIEADGLQHNIEHSYYRDRKDLILNDKLKNEWCKNNNVYLIRIIYNRSVTKNYVLKALRPFFNGTEEIISSEALKKGTFRD